MTCASEMCVDTLTSSLPGAHDMTDKPTLSAVKQQSFLGLSYSGFAVNVFPI